ncbi:MAG: acetylxylan esterase [Bryobacteraceae bacterium]
MTQRILLFLAASVLAVADRIPWNTAELYKVPQVQDQQTSEPGVRALLFEGMPYKGKPTRVFAYYGAPAHAAGAKLPAMVLIHGGGGTAFAEWVRLWNSRGYAAIAMDTVGTRPAKAEGAKLWNPDRTRDEFSGPAGWGDFDNVDLPPQDQWSYHAVAAAVRAHSLLRSFAEVDPKRIGVTGISWGGYLTSIVSGVDQRFRFAAPVYGCGFLGEDSAWLPQFAKLGEARAGHWLSLWDPSRYLAAAKLPMLWVNGTNDFAYPLPSWQKSYRLTKGKRTLAVRVRMKHSHPDGAVPEEIHAYADAMLKKGEPLGRVAAQGMASGRMWVKYAGGRAPAKAELEYTADTGKWQDRKWETVPGEIDGKTHRASARVPAGAKAYYLNLFDESGRVVSSEHVVQ